MKASEIMTRKVIAVEPDASILQAVHLMLQNRISGLPVIDATGNLVGILAKAICFDARKWELRSDGCAGSSSS